MEKMIEKNKKMFVAFVDLEKAYDTVSMKKLWRVLEEYIQHLWKPAGRYKGTV